MAQHDYVIANGTGAAVRSDLNNALAAIVSQNSGAVAPTTTYAYMPWADTGSSPPVFKIRNAANNGWITLYELDGTFSIEAGSASSPGLYFTGDTNTGIYSPGADQFGISTGGTSRLVIDSSGNVNIDSGTLYVDASNNRVGIGTTTAVRRLHVAVAGSDPQLRLQDTSATESIWSGIEFNGDSSRQAFIGKAGSSDLLIINDNANGALRFSTNATERARIDSSGRLLVGTSTAASAGNSQFTKIQIVGDSGTGQWGGLSLRRNEAATSITTDEPIGGITFGDSSGNDFAQIFCFADANAGSSDYPGRLTFSTTADGASSPTERMRITSGGGFKASNYGGYTLGASDDNHEFDKNTPGAAALHVYHTASSGIPYGIYFKFTQLNPNNLTSYVFTSVDNTNANIYTIYSNGTVVARSDAKFKKNIETTRDGYLEDLAQLRVVKYNWYNHDDDAPKELGFIAQEVEQVFPGLVSTVPDKDDQGNETDEVSKSIKTSVFTPMLVKALQEALERIKALEAKVAALESN